jgi:hypothetical protein
MEIITELLIGVDPNLNGMTMYRKYDGQNGFKPYFIVDEATNTLTIDSNITVNYIEYFKNSTGIIINELTKFKHYVVGNRLATYKQVIDIPETLYALNEVITPDVLYSVGDVITPDVFYNVGDVITPAVLYNVGDVITPAVLYNVGDVITPAVLDIDGITILTPAVLALGTEIKIPAVLALGTEIKIPAVLALGTEIKIPAVLALGTEIKIPAVLALGTDIKIPATYKTVVDQPEWLGANRWFLSVARTPMYSPYGIMDGIEATLKALPLNIPNGYVLQNHL